jgi:hypothetical protein
MSPQALPRRRVASASSPIPPAKFSQLLTTAPRPWPHLSAATQTQIARTLAVLLRRMLTTHVAPRGDAARADRRENR